MVTSAVLVDESAPSLTTSLKTKVKPLAIRVGMVNVGCCAVGSLKVTMVLPGCCSHRYVRFALSPSGSLLPEPSSVMRLPLSATPISDLALAVGRVLVWITAVGALVRSSRVPPSSVKMAVTVIISPTSPAVGM